MANHYLILVYKRLFDDDFSYSRFEDRMQMQKGIYLLQNMGVPVGDYGFRWYKHGPYSQSLQDDMFYEDGKAQDDIHLTDESTDALEQLHRVIHSNQRGNYSISHWTECLASIHYLKENILSRTAREDDILTELTTRKSHLNNVEANKNAYRLIEDLFA